MFNKKLAEKHLNGLLRHYGIRVTGWSTTSSGRANWMKKEIKIPKPTNADRFGVAMHEVKHIIDGDKGKRFEQEFACDMYAREQMIFIGCGEAEIAKWDKRTNWHSLSRIAMAVNRGLSTSKIGPEIREWFHFVDFEQWSGKKVFIRHNKTKEKGYTIELSENIGLDQIRALLFEKGLTIEMSETDDSTFGHWMVGHIGESGDEFENLTEVVNHYKLGNEQQKNIRGYV